MQSSLLLQTRIIWGLSLQIAPPCATPTTILLHTSSHPNLHIALKPFQQAAKHTMYCNIIKARETVFNEEGRFWCTGNGIDDGLPASNMVSSCTLVGIHNTLIHVMWQPCWGLYWYCHLPTYMWWEFSDFHVIFCGFVHERKIFCFCAFSSCNFLISFQKIVLLTVWVSTSLHLH